MPLEEDIAVLNRDFADAYRGLDFGRLRQLYVDDAMAVWRGHPLVHGADAIVAGLREQAGPEPVTLGFRSLRSWESGDLVVDVGTWTIDGQEGPGKYVVVLARQADGSLKLLVDCPLES
jgi:ketosteroid isomerase-like protein